MTGVYKRYYKNGQVKVIGNLINSIPNGKWEEYYESGKLQLKTNFIDGVNSSYRYSYYENGQLKAIYYIDENGSIHGKFKEFYENGKIHYQENFVNGRPNGKSKWYYENGKLMRMGDYVHGDKTGKWTFYYENGQLKETGNYINNEKVGEWKYYNENGIEKEQLKIRGTLEENGAVGYGNVYTMHIERVLQGDLKQDTIYIVVLAGDEMEYYFEPHLLSDIVEILFTKHEENVEYEMMPLNGFVDKNRTSWQIQQLIRE